MNIKRRIFEFLINCQAEWRHVPTRHDVRWTFGGLTDDVDLHLEQLEREGLIRLEGSEDDAEVQLTRTFEPAPEIWLRDSASSGPAEPPPGEIRRGALTLDLRGIGVTMDSEMYAVRVPDDSMIDAGIERGDIAILAHVPAKRGDIVAFEMNGRTVLRRYLLLSDIPHVLAENGVKPDLLPAYDLALHGVFWGLIRTASSRRVHRNKAVRKPIHRVGVYVRNGDEISVRGRPHPIPSDEVEITSPKAAAKPKAEAGRATRRSIKNACKHLPKPPSKMGLNDAAESIYGRTDG